MCKTQSTNMNGKIKVILDSILTYETPKMVEITNYKIGFIHRLLQFIIAIYVIW